jgi:catechol 2,3-dioxygenase-like lactoylglutathione lyase family enzyme
MSKLLSILALIFLGPVGISWAQLAPANRSGVAMGHLHYQVRDVEANKKFWIAVGGTPAGKVGTSEVVKFPDVLVLLKQGESSGGTEGSVVNHVGFRAQHVLEALDKLKAAGYKTELSSSGTGKVGNVFSPEGERIELLEDQSINVKFVPEKGQEGGYSPPPKMSTPIWLHHIHFDVPENSVAAIKAWYGKLFGGIPGKRYKTVEPPYEAVDLPGVNLNFSGVPDKLAPTKGRMLDHIGFEVKNLEAFCKKLEASGVKLDTPYKKNSSGLGVAFLTDPWGTSIELTEGLIRY